MDAEMKAQYQEKGYIVVKNIVPADAIANLYQVVAKVFKKYVPMAQFSLDMMWTDPKFNQTLLQFRKENPHAFGAMFDTIQTSVALWRLGTERQLCTLAGELMGEVDTGLSVTDMLLRLDAPQDMRNKLEWHQDSSYFRQNDRGENGCVCSIAMLDVPSERGPLEVLPGSHNLGRIEVASVGKDNNITSEQFRVPSEYTERYSPEQVVVNVGDAIFFNFDLIHRSGFNSSDLFRFTAIARFHRMLTADFKPGRLVYRPRPNTVAHASSDA
jgi:ectoine hydroxylase-related dioxygenase (phytanoyl-CoA dioxygenase family)